MTLPKRAFAAAASVLVAGAACVSAPSAATVPQIIPPVAGSTRDLGNIQVIDISQGTGRAYAPRRCIYTHYTGWLANGTKFDSSRETSRSGVGAEPVAFVQGVKQVIDGWDIGFDGMRVGGA